MSNITIIELGKPSLLKILKFIPARDVPKFAGTCRLFRSIAEQYLERIDPTACYRCPICTEGKHLLGRTVWEKAWPSCVCMKQFVYWRTPKKDSYFVCSTSPPEMEDRMKLINYPGVVCVECNSLSGWVHEINCKHCDNSGRIIVNKHTLERL